METYSHTVWNLLGMPKKEGTFLTLSITEIVSLIVNFSNYLCDVPNINILICLMFFVCFRLVFKKIRSFYVLNSIIVCCIQMYFINSILQFYLMKLYYI